MIPSPTTVPLLCKRLVIRGGGGEDRVTMTELLSMAMVDSYFECHSDDPQRAAATLLLR